MQAASIGVYYQGMGLHLVLVKHPYLTLVLAEQWFYCQKQVECLMCPCSLAFIRA